MSSIRRKMCRHCQTLFRPDSRTRKTQKFCSNPACKKVSKAESQKRWLDKPENKDYFRGDQHVHRMQQWRKKQQDDNEVDMGIQSVASHNEPKMSSQMINNAQQSIPLLQEMTFPQTIDNKEEIGTLNHRLLQEMKSAQPIVLLGLIAHLTDSTLQDEIASTTSRLQQLGMDILNFKNPIGAHNDL